MEDDLVNDFLFFIPTTALFDSLSTAIQIVIAALLLSTAKPKRTFWLFIIGLIGAYIGCGILFLTNIAGFNSVISKFIPDVSKIPDSDYYSCLLYTSRCV